LKHPELDHTLHIISKQYTGHIVTWEYRCIVDAVLCYLKARKYYVPEGLIAVIMCIDSWLQTSHQCN